MKNVRLDIIRYANCWEDADLLLAGLRPKAGSKIVSIASGGDNAFALLGAQPELLVAVDMSFAQLHLVELKKLAIQTFEYEEFIEFIGLKSSGARLKVYSKIRLQLSAEAQDFWDQNQEKIENGLIFQGKFERYFHAFRKYILPFIHDRQTTIKLLKIKTQEEQTEFYRNTWNSRRWRWLFKIFFSRTIMGKFGRDPQFLNQVEIPVADFIFQKAENELSVIKCQENYFLRMILLGEFGDNLPPYLRPENYDLLRNQLPALQLHTGLLQDCFKKHRFDYFNLSNIFEYMPMPVFQSLANEIGAASNPDARIAYWNLMVPRHLSGIASQYFESIDVEDQNQKDKGFFYRQFIVDRRL